ncbi:MAG: gas vesicle protein GvpG [Pseudomonadota bacterium]
MGLLGTLMTLPVAGPLKGSLWVAKKIHETAENELNDPSAIRRALARLEEQLLAGEISEDDYDEAEMDLLLRLRKQGP